jgi:phosphotransferase system  glucose/maltose/N-acetylglucosamine-specific IIC component
MRTGISPILNGFIIIVLACIFYLLFLFICAKIDKRKEERMKDEETKDPFIKH